MKNCHGTLTFSYQLFLEYRFSHLKTSIFFRREFDPFWFADIWCEDAVVFVGGLFGEGRLTTQAQDQYASFEFKH